MSSVNTQPKLRVHVLCSGIRYGNGERTFYDHFQKAWIQDPVELPIIGDGLRSRLECGAGVGRRSASGASIKLVTAAPLWLEPCSATAMWAV